MTPHLGVDIGGTKIHAALVAERGRVVDHATADTPAAAGPVAVLDAAAALALRIGGSGTVGVGAAGTIDPATGAVSYATDSLPGWAGTRVAQELASRLGRPVVVDNDVNAGALGEAWCGAARGLSEVLVVAAGTGLGGALLRNGRIEHGARGGAGELAHMPVPWGSELRCGCGRTGHLEGVASGTGLSRAYRSRTGRRLCGRAVAARAAEGDAIARAVVTTAGQALGRTLAGLVALLDPHAVILAGGAAETLLPPTTEAYEAELLPPFRHIPLLLTELGGDAVAVGAARLAMTWAQESGVQPAHGKRKKVTD
ncbi:ROK family protein [Streptomyces sp. NPDC005318]|uniref:ROK family protein n=1 Tax=Streptomyces sp. NPDC005318 TaxID=3157031 RepID=UPI0033A10FCC